MTERQEPYITTSAQQPVNIIGNAPVTITVSAEWADFLTRAQAARKEWRAHQIERVAIIDWSNLEIGRVIAFERS